ncbi:hypothetical protein J4731_21095 [Providencia rettgeri]|nr:hypothetical protein [Providencia rettgeri]
MGLGIRPLIWGYFQQAIFVKLGKGPIKEFNIKLIDCRWEKYSKDNNEWNSLEVTFDGPSEGDFSHSRVKQKSAIGIA